MSVIKLSGALVCAQDCAFSGAIFCAQDDCAFSGAVFCAQDCAFSGALFGAQDCGFSGAVFLCSRLCFLPCHEAMAPWTSTNRSTMTCTRKDPKLRSKLDQAFWCWYFVLCLVQNPLFVCSWAEADPKGGGFLKAKP